MKAALGTAMTKVATIDILALTDQDKRRLRRDVLAEYAAWVDQVSEDCDFKTEFSQKKSLTKLQISLSRNCYVSRNETQQNQDHCCFLR